MSATFEASICVEELRRKARDGTLTLEETRAAVAFLRSQRAATPAVSAGTKARKTAKTAEAIDSDALLAGLGGL